LLLALFLPSSYIIIIFSSTQPLPKDLPKLEEKYDTIGQTFTWEKDTQFLGPAPGDQRSPEFLKQFEPPLFLFSTMKILGLEWVTKTLHFYGPNSWRADF
jgi:hypothetical protein